ncbi:MAG: pyridoxal phosphate-dependent aminotransferase [Blautia sp.]|nr:pyridoxal phosphate-dependent aminotransferase [Blautia sp.]
MPERNLNFDKVIPRRGTGALKTDYAAKRGKPADILPLWVADMDFATSSYIQDALRETVEHGIWGYSEPLDPYFDALRSWMKRRHGWEVEEDQIIRTPGVVFALAMAVKAYTEPGDAILIQQPVYYPFSEVIRDNGRRIVSSDLLYDREAGRYTMNLKEVEDLIIREGVRLMLLCSPHNPVGRVWTRKELHDLGEICLRHRVLVVSDEIHEDFVFSGKHCCFPLAGEGFAENCIICTSPSKTFNLAGLQLSNIVIPGRENYLRFRREVDKAGYSQAPLFGLRACEAGYARGEEWLDALLSYLKENLAFLEDFCQKNLPGVRVIRPEGTYLVWMDFSDLGLSVRELDDLIIYKAGLWLDSGRIFGRSGEGFQRINIACPRLILKEALERLAGALGLR